jgi:hypothetical protein
MERKEADMNGQKHRTGWGFFILVVVSGLSWACTNKNPPGVNANGDSVNHNASQNEMVGTGGNQSLVLNADSGQPVPGLKVIGFSPEKNTIVFTTFEINQWYRRPLILKKGDAAVLFCFESPFFSSYFHPSTDMDAVFWFPGVENEFGKASHRDDRLTMKVQILRESARDRLRSIVGPGE